MPISTKNKVYFGIVACGLAALVTDRLTRSPDDSAASAAAASPSSLLVTPNERAIATSTTSSATAPSASEAPTTSELLRLAAQKSGWNLSAANDSHNPFANDNAGSQRQKSKSSQSAATFAQTHHLTAVITADGQSDAMVDGQIYNAGQCLDGFTLVLISLRSATFQNGNDRAVLIMQGYSPILDSAASRGATLSGGR